MGHHGHATTKNVTSNLGPLGERLRSSCIGLGAAGIIAAIAHAVYLSKMEEGAWRRFAFAYVVAFAFILAIAMGGLFFTFIQHLTRAGWSVLIRRMAEALASNFVVVGILFVPLAVIVLRGGGELYPWARPETARVIHEVPPLPLAKANKMAAHNHASHAADEHAHGDDSHATAKAHAHGAEGEHGGPAHQQLDDLTMKKRAWLNPPAWVARWAFYLALWGGLGLFFWRGSVAQDSSGDARLTERRERVAAPTAFVFGLTLTFASWDLLMSVNPHWYSTIFGVYFFAGCVTSVMSVLILMTLGLQRAGVLPKDVSIEHKHDMGKLLFAFTFFWGYIAFSQYMLLWYASLPETVAWLRDRGASTKLGESNGWSTFAIFLVLGHFVFPFLGLLSRHVKRNMGTLAFFAVWMLIMEVADLMWLVLPELGPEVHIGLIEIGLVVGLTGLFFAGVFHRLSQVSVVPTHDPRLDESLAFQNL